MHQPAFAIGLIVPPIALIVTAVRPTLNPSAMSAPLFPLSFIDRPVLEFVWGQEGQRFIFRQVGSVSEFGQ